MDSLCNIAKEKVILLNPFDYEDSSDWLNLIYEITEANWAKEHAECTMPILEDMERYAQSRGYWHKIIPNGSKMLSISLVFMEHYANMLGRQNELNKINNKLNTINLDDLISEKSPNAYLIEFDVRK
ncbi:hypothetical protein ABEX47_23295 [Paenibacillus ehimensis]|uniref:hypothetical protein n=1 Tax=Paenibacillus ehimensis TaxID=79264 RepID=UPI003D26F83C